MNLSHIHLILNHFPVIGFGIALGLFLVSLVAKNDPLKRASLVLFFVAAAWTIATYVSGNDAQQSLLDAPGISPARIAAHESAALIAFLFMQATGFFAWLGLWLWRQRSRLPAWNTALLVILSIATFGLMARASNMGGEIMHSEIHASPAPEGDGSDTIAKVWGKYVEGHSWVWPTSETLHFIGLSLLIGVVLTLDLRILGIGKSLSYEALYQLLPLGMLGFTINLITGMVFFVATPHQYTGFLFFLKMALVVFGAFNVLYFTLSEEPWTIDEGRDAPIKTKIIAVSALVIWIAVLFCGHMLPFLGNSF